MNLLGVPCKVSSGELVEFDEKEHKYTFQGKQADFSVSKAIEEFMGSEFDREEVASRIVASLHRKRKIGKKLSESEKSVPTSMYGDNQAQVRFLVETWNASRDYGTKCHAFIEEAVIAELRGEKPDWTNLTLSKDMPLKMQDTVKRFFCALNKEGWTPLFPEHRVFVDFGNNTSMAGSMDLVLVRKNTNEYAIVDWKFCKSISAFSFNKFGKAAYGFGNVPQSKLHKYSVQLLLYKHMFCASMGVQHSSVQTAIFCINPNSMKGKLIYPLDVGGCTQHGLHKLVKEISGHKQAKNEQPYTDPLQRLKSQPPIAKTQAVV